LILNLLFGLSIHPRITSIRKKNPGQRPVPRPAQWAGRR
jgi:hypothetical protein